MNKPNLMFPVVITLIFGLLPLSEAAAQSVLEEVIVTAQKREESLQDAPLAVTALSGRELSRAGINDPEGLANNVPNFTVTGEPNRDGLVITIRGVAGTDVRNAADPTTAFHVDGSYVPRMSGANAYFFDTDRVEVLRGPQGTLYGRNSTSGVVNVISNKPQLGELDAAGEVTVGNYSLFRFDGALNIPLSDTLATRLAVMRHDRDGFRENRFYNNEPMRNGDDADELAGRFHLLWEPTDVTSVLFTAEHYSRDGVGQVLVGLPVTDIKSLPDTTDPFGTRLINANNTDPALLNNANAPDEFPLGTQGSRNNHDNNFRLEINHSFNHFDAVYLGAYRVHKRSFMSDTRGVGTVVPTVSPAVPSGIIPSDDFLSESTTSETWTHEVRFASNNDGPFEWLLGFFYLEEEIFADFDVQLTRDPALNAAFSPPFLPNGSDRISVNLIFEDQTSESIAGFFNGSYDINESLTLNGGVRWTRDEKDSGRAFGDPDGSRMILSLRPPGGDFVELFTAPQVVNENWSEVTWKVGLDWHVNRDTLAYATVGTGYKAGGYNRGSQGLTPDGSLATYDPETILAYEAGLKMDFLDGRGRLNFAGFYYDYEDLQQAAIRTAQDGTRVNTTFNATDAEIWGLEAEGTLLIGETGSISFSAGYLDAEIGSLEIPDDLQNGLGVDVSGAEMINAPEFNATIGVIPMTFQAFGGTLTPRFQVHYETESWFTLFNRPQEEKDDFTRTDITLTYEHNNSGWYGEAFVHNLEDDDVLNDSICGEMISSGSPLADPLLACTSSFSPPRTFGIRIGFQN